jgi:hypothetical protein
VPSEPLGTGRDIHRDRARDSSSPLVGAFEDPRAQLATELRALIARLGAAIAASEFERARAADALQRLSEAMARAGRHRPDGAAFDDDFVETYCQLRAKTEALSRAERHAGDPPEVAVKMLKSLFVDSDTTELAPDAIVVVERDVVRWGIDAYFAA